LISFLSSAQTRLAAIARGTEEVDTVYHIAFEELIASTEAVGAYALRRVLHEVITQNRLEDFAWLSEVLAIGFPKRGPPTATATARAAGTPESAGSS
jgi:NgoMIV restriction enzyme